MTVLINNDEDFFIEESIDLKDRLKNVTISASNLKVDSEETFKIITSLYAESKEWEKKIEFTRKQANTPDQDRINHRNDKAKELLVPLKQIQEIAKKKTAQYQLLLEETKRQEEEKIKESVEMLGLDEMPYLVPAEKSQRGDGAIAYTKEVTKFRLVDLSKVPLKYLKIDESMIERDLKLGVNEIPGIEIFQEKQTTLRTR